jgi:cytosine/adenosine deaminase-related metal-dependent hydrolase
MIHAIGIGRVNTSNGSPVAHSTAPELRLHGQIVLPNGFVPDGTIRIRGERIVEVFRVRTPGGDLELDTGGLITPGFVDTHNHAAHAVFPRWNPAQKMSGRFDWRGKTRCGVYVVPVVNSYYQTNISRAFKDFPITDRPLLYQYGQARGLLGGATTMMIDAEYPDPTIGELPGFVRDFTDWPIQVYGVLDIGCLPDATRTPNEPGADAILAALTANTARLLVHLGEGNDGFARGEFFTLKLVKKLLTRNTALIHAMALIDEDWEAVKQAGASVIWSPVSNHRLYGRTIDIDAILSRGIRVALAPDWSLTGSSTVLDELSFVRQAHSSITSERLFSMVTDAAADILGFELVGRIAPRRFADLLVFEGQATTRVEATERVVSAGIDGLRLVLIGGLATYGTPQLMSVLADQPGPAAEPINVPFRNNTTLPRVLRFDTGNGASFASMVTYLKSVKPDLAPLWEE